MTTTYQPTWDSVRSHPLPAWYEDAKLGVFLHWGLYSVPGWAPQVPDIQTILRQHDPAWMLAHNPYAEWYANTMRLPGSPTQRHHEQTYGAGFGYDDFVPRFEAASAGADLTGLAGLCREAGARYVVLTTKHHEGYCLWPTEVAHPVKGAYHSPRDLVGDLGSAVRAEGMRLGLYYSGGYDWPYNGAVLRRLADVALAVPADAGYARYVEAHVGELVERYRPSVLWNDIGWPQGSDLAGLFARYYNAVDEGVVNDRWHQGTRRSAAGDRLLQAGGAAVERLWPRIPARYKRLVIPHARHADFTTPEYTSPREVVASKWEATRGVGHSFGANRNEAPGDLLSTTELVRLLVDVVSKNGNLLIGVGPTPDGRVPEWQAAPLLGLGRWLAVNGEAIYGTRPWSVASGLTSDGTAVRFTLGDGALYATLTEAPGSAEVALRNVAVHTDEAGGLSVRLLGRRAPLEHRVEGGTLRVTLPARLGLSPAHVLRVTPASACRARQIGGPDVG